MKNINLPILLLRLCLICLVLMILAGFVYIWIAGEKETNDAFASGRRIIISLEKGDISGKIISSEDKQPEKSDEKKDATIDPPKDEAKPEIEQKPEEVAKPVELEKQGETGKELAKAEEKSEPTKVATATSEPTKTEPAEIVATINSDVEEQTEFPPIPPSTSPPAILSKELSEKTEFGTLPKISNSGEKAWKYYAKPIILKSDKPKIAIIVSNIGKGKTVTDMALRLPEAINISFSAYSKTLVDDAAKARLAGHELMLDLPMEAANYPASDPGPLGLLVSKEQEENEVKIKKLMAQEIGYVGFLTPQNEIFLANNDLLKALLQIMSGRGLMLTVGKKPAKDETIETIEKSGTASIIADTLIDEELTNTAIDARLSLLEQIAKEKGYAVGVAGAYPISINRIGEWAKKAEENGFVLVPVSVIIGKRS